MQTPCKKTFGINMKPEHSCCKAQNPLYMKQNDVNTLNVDIKSRHLLLSLLYKINALHDFYHLHNFSHLEIWETSHYSSLVMLFSNLIFSLSCLIQNCIHTTGYCQGFFFLIQCVKCFGTIADLDVGGLNLTSFNLGSQLVYNLLHRKSFHFEINTITLIFHFFIWNVVYSLLFLSESRER